MLEGADKPLVGLIMGSDSDWETMKAAALSLDRLGIKYSPKVVSAHRTPELLYEYADAAEDHFSMIIAGAGGAAHLPGMTASMTLLPVLGVPVVSRSSPLKGVDAFLSIMQMPPEVGVATLGLDKEGAKNAGILAATILAHRFPHIRAKLNELDINRGLMWSGASKSDGGVALVMASENDWEQAIKYSVDKLKRLGIRYEKFYVDAKRGRVSAIVREAEKLGLNSFIVGASYPNSFTLPAQVAAETMLPVLSVPIAEVVDDVNAFLNGVWKLPPKVATFALNRAGAINAALFSAAMLFDIGSPVWHGLDKMRKDQEDRVRKMTLPVRHA